MTTPRLEEQRFRLGIWPVSDLTNTYEVGAFSVQSDQSEVLAPWIVGTQDTEPPHRARSEMALDGTVIEDGYYIFQWYISYMTFGMVKYWNATKLGGATTAACTVMTYDQNNEAVYLTAKTSKLVFPRDGRPWPGGWRDVIIKFNTGVIIT